MQLSLKYLLKEPIIISEKSPLILLLHGYGSNPEDLFSFKNELPKNAFIVSAQAPNDLQYGSYAWYEIDFDADENKFSDLNQARQSRDLVLKFIDELTENYPIDHKQITLIGFSQGAILSYSIALSFPKKIAKVVAFSGYLILDIATVDYAVNDFSNIKMFISHGTQDQVIPVEWSRKAPETLRKLGIMCEYHEYPMGHGINQQNFLDFQKWFAT